jgi:hypothetical protein
MFRSQHKVCYGGNQSENFFHLISAKKPDTNFETKIETGFSDFTTDIFAKLIFIAYITYSNSISSSSSSGSSRRTAPSSKRENRTYYYKVILHNYIGVIKIEHKFLLLTNLASLFNVPILCYGEIKSTHKIFVEKTAR